MLHFSTIKTEFVSKAHLKQALSDVQSEFGLGEVRENVRVSGFGGQSTEAELVASTRNRGDVGFRREGDAHGLVADWYGLRDIAGELSPPPPTTVRLPCCAWSSSRSRVPALVEEEVREDRSIHLMRGAQSKEMADGDPGS
jgi:hypothetical protein